MSYFGVSTRNGVGLGLGTVPSLTNTPLGYRLAPSLNLSFAGSDTLDPRITFSRTTNATLTNSAGLVANAPMNLLTFSEQFDNAAWTKNDITVTANATAAPNGTLTADAVIPTVASSSIHRVRQDATTSATAHTTTVYAKPFGYTKFGIIEGAATGAFATFDLSGGGSVISTGSGGAGTVVAVGDGWYRCSVTFTASTTARAEFRPLPDSYTTGSPSITFAGDGTSGIYIWGAQLELGSTATTYNPTTVKNLLGFTENFDNAAWTKSNASISATKVDDIYGQPFAQQVTSSASNGTVLSTYTAVASTPYTFSIWMKRVTGTGNIDISADGTTWATQTLTTEWQRFSVTVSPTAGSKTPGVRIATSGDSIYIFGAQLSDSASVDPYVYQPVAAPTSVAYYGPRFDYDPVTLAPKGLLIEEQRTNLLTYSEQFDNAAWSETFVTATQNSTTAPNGTITADLISETTSINNHFLLSAVVAMISGTAYTLSVFMKKGSGATAPDIVQLTLPGALFGVNQYANYNISTGVVTASAGGALASISSAGDDWYRLTYTATATSTGSAGIGAVIFVDNNPSASRVPSYAGVVTSDVFIWGAQLEAGAFATSYIPTVASQVTRAADSASMIGNNFARWYNPTNGTFFVEWASAESGNGDILNVSDGTANNFISTFKQAARLYTQYVVVGGSLSVNQNRSQTYPVGASYKNSFAYKAADFSSTVNGGSMSTTLLGTVPVVSRLNIGANATGAGEHINGAIERVAFYSRVLAASEQQGITS